MMIGNLFLTVNKAKWGYPQNPLNPPLVSHDFSNQGTPKEDLVDFVLVCLTLYTETLYNNFPGFVSTISLPQRIHLLCLQMDIKGIIRNYTLNKCECK